VTGPGDGGERRLAEGVIADEHGQPRVAPEAMTSFGSDALPPWDIERIRAWRRDYYASVRFDFADAVLRADDLDATPDEQ
jgi:hypothetical protein